MGKSLVTGARRNGYSDGQGGCAGSKRFDSPRLEPPGVRQSSMAASVSKARPRVCGRKGDGTGMSNEGAMRGQSDVKPVAATFGDVDDWSSASEAVPATM